jgi:hypothetical protein
MLQKVNFFFKRICLKNFTEITEYLFETPKTSKTQVITAVDDVLI